jgi:hypothetical protein
MLGSIDVPEWFRELELESDAGKVNLAIIVLIALSFGFAQLIGALGALADRIFYALKWLPRSHALRPYVDTANTWKEARFTALLGVLCVASIALMTD